MATRYINVVCVADKQTDGRSHQWLLESEFITRNINVV